MQQWKYTDIVQLTLASKITQKKKHMHAAIFYYFQTLLKKQF